MCEILVRLQNGSNPDQTANPLRGYIVCLRPDGHQWGRAEVPPEYGSVSVPGLEPQTILDRERAWTMKVGVEVVEADYAQDIFTLRASATAYNTRTGEGKVTAALLTAAKVERFLESWAATGIAFSDNAVTFTVRVADAYKTQAFWGIGIDGLAFSEVSYDQATGIHRVRINYSALTLTTAERDKLRAALADSSTFVSINTGQKVITVDIQRSTVRERFMEEVRERIDRITLRRRRYRLNEAACSAIEAAGGHITATAQQLAANIIDHLTE